MTLRERVGEDLAADLEYHPKRGLLYLGLAVAAMAVWIQYPSGAATVPLVALLGGVALLLKGAFLFRKSSEGLGLTVQELERLSDPANRKSFPPIPILAAQIIQDFGAGPLVLAPFLHSLENTNPSWVFPTARVFFTGAVLVAVGWSIRHFAASRYPQQ